MPSNCIEPSLPFIGIVSVVKNGELSTGLVFPFIVKVKLLGPSSFNVFDLQVIKLVLNPFGIFLFLRK